MESPSVNLWPLLSTLTRFGRAAPLSCLRILIGEPMPGSGLTSLIKSNIRKIWLSKGDEFETGKKELLDSLRLLGEELGEKPYFGGKAFGFVDIALIGFYTRFHTVETIANFSLEAECPKLVQWANKCVAEKPSVSNCLPDPHKVLEFSLQVKKKGLLST